jgi:hypothetical protein
VAVPYKLGVPPSGQSGEGRTSFLKKRSKKLLLTGFGLSAEAQPEFVKVFWFFVSKKNRFLCRLPSVEAISIPGQLLAPLCP